MVKEEILQVLPKRLKDILLKEISDWNQLQEVRIRLNEPIALSVKGSKRLPNQNGQVVNKKELREILEYISRYSLYAFEEEIKKGFLTIPGGHRIGLAGQVVMENGKVKTMKHISFLNIRVAHEVKGCANPVMPYLFENGKLLSTLIASPPGAGKTTLLRDIIRQVASGGKMFTEKTVSVIDERSELAGSYMGKPTKDMGIHCDVLDACGKVEGIHMMLRSMSPEIIAVDEIGTEEDLAVLEMALTTGCALLATIHGSSFKQLREKTSFQKMLADNMFERVIFLKTDGIPGKIQGIYDGKGQVLCG
ncbi:MAG: stage III sporulation protein AA [Eubacterium sp.]|nr:stage III sporulation protein AA [Eubacterium sp.]